MNIRELHRNCKQIDTPILFNSAVDALNYLNGYGWTLVEVRSDDSGSYYLMRRAISQPKEAISN